MFKRTSYFCLNKQEYPYTKFLKQMAEKYFYIFMIIIKIFGILKIYISTDLMRRNVDKNKFDLDQAALTISP